MDDLSPAQRHRNMINIRSADTKCEDMVRKFLFSKGFRYRKNDRRYPGKPDIVLPKYRTIVFIHGCFWHQHPGCKYAVLPKSNTDYWLPKLKRNSERDKNTINMLVNASWKVIIVWECALKANADCTLEKLSTYILSDTIAFIELPTRTDGM